MGRNVKLYQGVGKLFNYLNILVFALCSLPSAVFSQLHEAAYVPESYEAVQENTAPGYPSVDGFFGKKTGENSFFRAKDVSSSSMFDSSSAVPSFEGVSNVIAVEPREEVKQYEIEVRNEKEEYPVSQNEEQGSEETEAEVPEPVKQLDSSIERAMNESSSDPKIQSALKASRDIREAIFGKKVVAAETVKTKGNQQNKGKEESVRF